ncbi:VWA domain-containing protein [Agrobacterium sp. ICMP 7243]|nr:VWA domain-containing protein [Agrobacterium sp. ICMP 7243]NTG16333.1 VWA domain-containing protein [Rhizobium rhizogenes]NTG30011.1 VWA domain-containing protein [Rhizobium rhizogenes]NTH66646.1 VWA domain-containing protein [Rhizobium rhizogenes]
MIEEFHFLRPWWLLSLLVPIGILWFSSQSGDIRSRWKGTIAPHLLDNLIVGGKRGSRIQPSWLLAVALALSAFAAAGPTWQREQPPFVEDTAALVIAVDLSPTMDAVDISPSRLERAKLKIRDIVADRGGGRTAVVAYAGSAHTVLPLTEDASLIETYTDALATRIMPVDGKNTAKALELANDMLSKESSSGTILFITDGVERTSFDAFRRKSENGLVVLGIGTADGGLVKTANGTFLTASGGNRILAKLDLEGLKNLHTQTGTDVATVTDDNMDVRWVAQRIRTNFAQKQAREGDRWRDMGWWIVVPLVVLFGAAFRKGWVVRTGVLLLGLRMFVPVDAEAAGLVDMWLTPDQQGRLAFERNDYDSAAAHFADPMWKGVSLYRAGKFADAIDAFATVDTAESWYDQGNALLHLLKLEEAVVAYRKALEARKDWPDAQANLAIAERLLKAKKEEEQEEQQPNEKPDQVQFDDKGKKGKEGELNIAEQTSEMWMKNIQISPADLMARKFALEAQKGKP